MTNLLDRLALECTMHPYHMAIEVWCEETWGERPVRISEWATHDSNVQVFIRLSSSVLIADFELNGEGMLGHPPDAAQQGRVERAAAAVDRPLLCWRPRAPLVVRI